MAEQNGVTFDERYGGLCQCVQCVHGCGVVFLWHSISSSNLPNTPWDFTKGDIRRRYIFAAREVKSFLPVISQSRFIISQRQVQGAVATGSFLRRESPSLLALKVISQGEMSK